MSTIRVNTIQSTSTTDGGISIDSSGHVTLDGQALPSAGPLSNRNLIINGAMQVAQRGTLTGVALNTATYTTCDRFQISGEGTSAVATTTQDSDAPNGFGSSLKIDVTTADASLAASDGVRLLTRLEGQDVQRIKKGTADAQQVTLSFSVKSPKTGTHIVELFDNDTSGQRTVSASYNITSANTWQDVSVTFPADTTGEFDNDNNGSLLVIWWLAAGSDYTSGTLQTSWAARTNANRAVGQVNCLDDAANDFFLTGVQLEVGSVATPFEHRSFDDELTKCQRYYQTSIPYGNAIAANSTYREGHTGGRVGNLNPRGYVPFISKMRATPSVTFWNNHRDVTGGDNAIAWYNSSNSWSNTDTTNATIDSAGFYFSPGSGGGSSYQFFFNWEAAAEL